MFEISKKLVRMQCIINLSVAKNDILYKLFDLGI